MKKAITIGLALLLAMLVVVLLAIIFLHRNYSEGNPLLAAAETGDLVTVKTLIQQGAPINEASSSEFGWTPLIGAIFHNQTNVVHCLVESGADVNLADRNGVTPLMWLTSRGDDGVPLVKFLIAHGARLNAKDKDGITVLGYAQSDPLKPQLVEVLKAAILANENKATNNLATSTKNMPQKP
jgi:ankyrin repeat protein